MPNLPSRPQLKYGDIWCLQCNKACDFHETAGHRLWSVKDSEGEGQGYIWLRAYCHDEHADIQLTFQEARHMPHRIEVFGDPSHSTLIETPKLVEDLRLTDKTMQA